MYEKGKYFPKHPSSPALPGTKSDKGIVKKGKLKDNMSFQKKLTKSSNI